MLASETSRLNAADPTSGSPNAVPTTFATGPVPVVPVGEISTSPATRLGRDRAAPTAYAALRDDASITAGWLTTSPRNAPSRSRYSVPEYGATGRSDLP